MRLSLPGGRIAVGRARSVVSPPNPTDLRANATSAGRTRTRDALQSPHEVERGLSQMLECRSPHPPRLPRHHGSNAHGQHRILQCPRRGFVGSFERPGEVDDQKGRRKRDRGDEEWTDASPPVHATIHLGMFRTTP